jgi:hypothetical protein
METIVKHQPQLTHNPFPTCTQLIRSLEAGIEHFLIRTVDQATLGHRISQAEKTAAIYSEECRNAGPADVQEVDRPWSEANDWHDGISGTDA